MSKAETCLECNAIIPEGRTYCPKCDNYDKSTKRSSKMIETIIMVDTPEKVKDFCQLCSQCEGDVDVYGGRYIVSGKSFLGLYSLDLTQPLKVEFHGDIPQEVKEGMKKFIVN